MKILKTFVVLTTVFCAFTACDSFTEFDRGFILTEEGSIENVNDLERLLFGTYNANGSYAGIISINTLGTDETRIGLGNRGQGLQAHSFTLNTASGEPLGIYNSAYNVLDNANRVLRSADEIPVGEDEIPLLNQIRGEALAIRAWQHFDLLRMFATDFNPNTTGVPLSDRVFVVGEDDLSIPRASVGEVLALVNADLAEAETLIEASGLTNINRFNVNAVRALQARVALYSGDFPAAVNLATQVIGAVPLVSGDTYIDMFRASGEDTEVIFQIDRDQFDGRIGTIWSDVNLDVFFSMSQDLFNEMSMAGADRLNLNVDLETEITERVATPDEQIVGKYLGSSELVSLNNIIVFRSSEMQLIRAEAFARMGGGFLSDAATDIADLRTVRGSAVTTPATYASVDEALTDILAERRVELAFEGHRLLDLKRFGEGINRIAEDCSGNGGERPATTCDLEAGSFRFTFPIPQAEIFANDGISDADQNPGY